MLFRRTKLGAASEKEGEEEYSEQGLGHHSGEGGRPGPEGGGDDRAVQQAWSGNPGPPPGGEEEGCSEDSGEQPARVVAEWNAVVGAAPRPRPEAQGRRAGVDHSIHPDEDHGGAEDVDEAWSGPPRGCHRPDDERRVGEGQEVGDDPGELRTEGVAVVEGTVREAGHDTEGLYGVGQDGESQQRERSPSWSEVAEERDG